MRVFPLVVMAFGIAGLVAMSDAGVAADKSLSVAMTFADGKDAGTITFTEANSGVLIKLDLKGVKPGAHGLHVHEVGKCEGDFSSAGGIHNPLGAQHGFLHEEGPMAGDLPNVYAAADGSVVMELVSTFLSLNKEDEDGLFDADGSAIVLFDNPDDYLSEGDGGAGARIACGVLKSP